MCSMSDGTLVIGKYFRHMHAVNPDDELKYDLKIAGNYGPHFSQLHVVKYMLAYFSPVESRNDVFLHMIELHTLTSAHGIPGFQRPQVI